MVVLIGLAVLQLCGNSCVKLTMLVGDMSKVSAAFFAITVLVQMTTSQEASFMSPPLCPEGFHDIDHICYFVTAKAPFPPKCPFKNVLPFDSYIDIIPTNVTPIWMPVRRALSNGLGFLQWTEASPLYKSDFDLPYFISNGIKNKDCLVYYNSTYIVAVPCNEEYAAVCAYSKLHDVSKQSCSNVSYPASILCHQSDFSPISKKCFCVGYGLDQSKYVKAEFVKPYQNIIYSMLTEDPCMIGLEKTSNGSYIWMNSRQVIDYSYWSKEASFDEENVLGATTDRGWILTSTPFRCLLYELEVDIPEPSLHLMYVDDGDVFRLTITNPTSLIMLDSTVLVYCFTNAGFLNLIYRYDSLNSVGNGVYEFEPHRYGPGDYWCEAFKYVDSEPITTSTVFHHNTTAFGTEFVAILKQQYVQGTNPLSKEVTEFLSRIFFLKFDSIPELPLRSRIMKIIDLDENTNQVWYNVHFTQLTSDFGVDEDAEFSRLKCLIKQIFDELSEMNMELVDFLSTSYCSSETDFLTWPRTAINHEALSSEFCFNANGFRVRRFCGGNFIDGARWSAVQNCKKPSNSSVTQKLLDLINTEPLDEEQFYHISELYEEFNSFDVYLSASIYEIWQQFDNAMFSRVLDNILKIDQRVLFEAQQRMRAMDMILNVTDKAAAFGVNSNNFITITSDAEFSGLIVQRDGSIIPLPSGTILDDITKIQNLEIAIWLSPELRSHLNYSSKITFKLFFSNVFFSSSDASKILDKILGVVFPDDLKSLPLINPIQVIYGGGQNDSNVCAFWSYNLRSPEGRGVWKKSAVIDTYPGFSLCNFSASETTGLALISNDSNSVTSDLNDLLSSNSSVADIINSLLTISERYYLFTANDVDLVGCILEKVSGDREIDLDSFGKIISNLHLIQRAVLKESQKGGATDKILYNLDVIVKNHNYETQVNVTTDQFMLFISNVMATNFTGLVLLNYTDKFLTEVLIGDVELEAALEYDNLESAFLLTSTLKQQLDNDSNIIITVFLNDGLFMEDSPRFKYVSKIFGVILPDFVNYSEPVSFVHNVAIQNDQRACVHWNYNTTSNVLGSWKHDNRGTNLMDLSHCQYWHTTHFALLLLDQDKYAFVFLDWITLVNCSLSLFGLCCIILTAVLFKRWRMNTGNQLLLNFVFAMILQIGILYASGLVKNTHDEVLCTVIGVALHYAIVSQFCWMFVIAVLQFKRFVEVFGGPPKCILLKACLCGWLLPCLPVACVYLLDNNNYVNGKVGLCYPSNLGLYLGVWLPVAIVVIINFVIFFFIIYNVVHKKTECSDAGNDDAMFQWRLAVLLFFMLGLTWTFGFLSELDFGEVFVYMFCITATLQGFVMFLFFIVFNANTRYLYLHALKRCCHNKKY